MKKNEKLSQKEISPLLLSVLQTFLTKKQTKNLKQYITLFNFVSIVYKRYTEHTLRQLSSPIFSTEIVLRDLEVDTEELYWCTLKVSEECQEKYKLSPRQERMISYLLKKNEEIFDRVSLLYHRVRSANNNLFLFRTEKIAEEIPYKKDFSKIFEISICLN